MPFFTNRMKTILITNFHPIIARNILFTPLLEKLGRDARVLIAVPDFKKEYFIKNFGVHATIIPFSTSLSRRTLLFRWLFLSLLNSKTLYIKKRSELYRDHRLFPFLSSVFLASTFGRSKLCIRLFRLLDQFFDTHTGARALFDEYHPDIVFSTDVQNESDVALMHEGRRHKANVIGMVRSWDNLSSKGIIRVPPDTLIVHNDLIVEEAVKYNHIDRERIIVTGIPHYDRYVKGPKTSHDEFFKKWGFDPKRKLVLFSPIGDRYIRENKLDQLVLDTLSKLPVNIFVRFPPCDEVTLHKPTQSEAIVVFERTGVSFWEGGPKVNEIDRQDDDTLIAELSCADVLVVGQSTLVVDASVFDVPSVIINFDEEKRNYYDSVKRYYDGEYYRLVKESGAVAIADSPTDLTRVVETCLQDSSINREARFRVVSERAALDGNSTTRLYEALAPLLR